jgi:multidrug efflux pump subunit AcrA (membrane-fusion protein)
VPITRRGDTGQIVEAWVAAAWWGLSSVGIGQPVATGSPTNAKAPAGRVEGGSDVLPLGTSATGTIAELLVHAGVHVQAGQHLVRVECSAIERELDARKSDLAAAEAFYLRTLYGPRVEEISVGIANVNLADARLQEAEKALHRTQQLREGFTVTRVQIDQALRCTNGQGAVRRSACQTCLAQGWFPRRRHHGNTVAARAAKGRVEEAAARLGYCSVDAPISGIVLNTNVSPGQLVSTMVPVTLLTMVDDSTRRVRAFVDETEISTICLRQRAHVTADAVPAMQKNRRHRRKYWRYSRPRPTCQRFVATVPADGAVGVGRPATDADWTASVSSILTVCRCAGRFRQVTSLASRRRAGPCCKRRSL